MSKMSATIKLNKDFLVIIYVLIICNLVIDIYLPMITQISQNLGTDINNVQSSISIEIVGFIFGSLLSGIYQKRYRFKHLVPTAALLAISGSLICAISQTIFIFKFGRIIQGAGAGILFTITGVLIVREYSGAALLRMYSMTGLVVSVVPLISPIIGASVGVLLGWRADFIFLALTFLGILFLYKDEVSGKSSKSLPLRKLLLDYMKPLRVKLFVFLVIISGLCLGGNVLFISLIPYYLEHVYNFNPLDISLVLAGVSFPLVIASTFNIILAGRYSSKKVIIVGIISCLFSGIVLLFINIEHVAISTNIKLVPFAFFVFGQFLIQLNTLGMAINYITDNKIKDSASAIQSIIYLVFGTLLGQVSNFLVANSAVVFGIIFTGISMLISILFYAVVCDCRSKKPI